MYKIYFRLLFVLFKQVIFLSFVDIIGPGVRTADENTMIALERAAILTAK